MTRGGKPNQSSPMARSPAVTRGTPDDTAARYERLLQDEYGATTLDPARPLFDVLGKTIVRLGEAGTGQTAKACNQILVAVTIEAVSEALVLASKAGVDPERLIEVLSGGLAGNRVMEVRRRNFLEHDFTPGFKLALHHKDLGIALRTARELGVYVPTTAIVDQMLSALEAAGDGGLDHSALLTVIEQQSSHRISE